MRDKILLLILLVVGATFTSVWLILLRKRLNMAWYVAILIAVLCIASGVLFVKAFAFIETGFNRNSFGNMSLFGAVFGMPLIFLLVSKMAKVPPQIVFDTLTPCMLFFRDVYANQLYHVGLLPRTSTSGDKRDTFPNA